MVFLLLLGCAAVASAGGVPAYPLKSSTNGRYLVDQQNTPFLMIGDSPHSLLANLNDADAAAYLLNRATNGVNTIWVELLCDSYTGGPGDDGDVSYGHDINNNNPFTNTLSGGYYDLTTPNPNYWSHVDYIVQTAGTNGIQCLLTPLDQGGWTTTSLANGTDKCFQYGRFLGNRYKDFPNIFWNMGNDFQHWSTPTNEAVILGIATGIQNTDKNHPITVQLWVSPPEDSLTASNWASIISVNGCYSSEPTYDLCLRAYNRTNVPVILLEAHYEDEAAGIPSEFGTPNVLRRQEYWSVLGGALGGHMYGNGNIWRFSNDWQSSLNSTGMAQLRHFKSLLTSRPWYNLVPDQTHSLLMAGYGTYASSGQVSDSLYAMAAWTPDGTLAMVFTPASATLTIAMSNFCNLVTARWFDPTAGTFAAINGSSFPNSGALDFTTTGNNSAGDPDWVLLLEAPPLSAIAPEITAFAFSNTDFVISFTTALGQNYELQTRPDPVSGPWLSIVTNIPGTGGTVLVADTNAASQFQRHYRVKAGL